VKNAGGIGIREAQKSLLSARAANPINGTNSKKIKNNG